MDRVVAGSKDDKRFHPVPHYVQDKPAEKPPKETVKTVYQEVEKEIVVPDPKLEDENATLKKEITSLKRKNTGLEKKLEDKAAEKPTRKKVVRRKT